MKIGILTFQDGYNRGSCDFYPLIKWDKKFKKNNIVISFYNTHKDTSLFNNDVVIIDHRYYRRLVKIDEVYKGKDFIVELITSLKSNGIKVILFDMGDGSGGRQWDLIEYVDIFLKKQVLKDKEEYTLNKGAYSYMPFLREYELSKKRVEGNLRLEKEYTPCPPEQLNKIHVGWNIGMIDYRYFPLSQFYPFGTNRLLNSFYKNPKFCTDFDDKTIDATFRGKINKDNENYAFQRNKVVELFEKRTNLITGDFISKNKYLKELRSSKACVSPFGWGEVCYRDFEAIINGCVLIKPDMDHLETWPDIYRKNETYIDIKWDMSDLEDTLNEVLKNYEDYKYLVLNAQQIYKEALKDGEGFVNRFKKILEHS